MSDDTTRGKHNGIDYSDVTPATDMNPDSKKLPETFANQMPTSDIPAKSGSKRADPDKVIPGPEAATGVDQLEDDQTRKNLESRQ